MNTFLPFADVNSVKYLDDKRLNKQREEVRQILNGLNGGGWGKHPGSLMWKGYETGLKYYGNACIREWKSRGHYCAMQEWEDAEPRFPIWFGLDEFHWLHRRNLIRKKPEFYQSFGWTELPCDIYLWPLENDGKLIKRWKQVGAAKYLSEADAREKIGIVCG